MRRCCRGITAMAFNQRRKMLRSSLKALGPDIEELLAGGGYRAHRAGRRNLAGEILRPGARSGRDLTM